MPTTRTRRRALRGATSVAASVALLATVGLAAWATDPGVDVVYVANGRTSADALVGSVLAAHDNAPLLTVDADSLPQATADELDRLQPQRIVVFGGPAAVSDGVVAALAAYAQADTADEVSRIFGQDRFETAAEIAKALPGAVGAAEDADHAETAGHAETTALATNSQRVGGLGVTELFHVSIPWNLMHVSGDGTGHRRWGPEQTGVVLPDDVHGNVSMSFQLPPTYPAGRNLVAEMLWVADDDDTCGVDLQPAVSGYSNAQDGFFKVGAGASEGIERLGGTPTAGGPAALNVTRYLVTGPADGRDLAPGDVVLFSVFRDFDDPIDTCTGEVLVQHVEIQLAAFQVTPGLVGGGGVGDEIVLGP